MHGLLIPCSSAWETVGPWHVVGNITSATCDHKDAWMPFTCLIAVCWILGSIHPGSSVHWLHVSLILLVEVIIAAAA
jgi:hypothetical protein